MRDEYQSIILNDEFMLLLLQNIYIFIIAAHFDISLVCKFVCIKYNIIIFSDNTFHIPSSPTLQMHTLLTHPLVNTTLYPGVLAAHIAILNFGHFMRQKNEQGAPSIKICILVTKECLIKALYLADGTWIGFQRSSRIP